MECSKRLFMLTVAFAFAAIVLLLFCIRGLFMVAASPYTRAFICGPLFFFIGVGVLCYVAYKLVSILPDEIDFTLPLRVACRLAFRVIKAVVIFML